ncbi:MAG: hypothetical protein EHM61_09160 [Acidobacteria bacterium]|nr:MAG: hypothetical protein EHM61_09160 [Acidobacteriota bacterium]
MHPLLILLSSVAVILLMILWLRVNAFLALLAAATTVGVLSPLVPLGEVMPKVAVSFGSVCARIGIIVALAAVIGECLLESGAADKITRVFIRLFGEKRSSLSLLTSAWVLGIPVFFDTVFYLLVPLARAMRIRTGRNYLLFLMSIVAGGITAHCMIPPTPGPLAMAANLNIDFGMMILLGGLVAIPMALVGWLFAVYRDRKLEIPLRETTGISLAELGEIAHEDDSRLPPFLWSATPIFLPVILITANTFSVALKAEGPVRSTLAFLGDPNLALLISTAISMFILARHKGYTLAQLTGPVNRAFAGAGLIILITAGGGAFGGMLVEAGVGRSLANVAQKYQLPLLLLGFFLSALLKAAQGSSTVAMITTSSIVAPLVLAVPPPYHPVYLACVIGSGSLVGEWMNDSAFWVYKQMGGLTEVETLKTLSPLLAVLGTTGLVASYVLAIVMPMR